MSTWNLSWVKMCSDIYVWWDKTTSRIFYMIFWLELRAYFLRTKYHVKVKFCSIIYRIFMNEYMYINEETTKWYTPQIMHDPTSVNSFDAFYTDSPSTRMQELCLKKRRISKKTNRKHLPDEKKETSYRTDKDNELTSVLIQRRKNEPESKEWIVPKNVLCNQWNIPLLWYAVEKLLIVVRIHDPTYYQKKNPMRTCTWHIGISTGRCH